MNTLFDKDFSDAQVAEFEKQKKILEHSLHAEAEGLGRYGEPRLTGEVVGERILTCSGCKEHDRMVSPAECRGSVVL